LHGMLFFSLKNSSLQRYIKFTKIFRTLKNEDVWNPMINHSNRPELSIFISDSLHMNRDEYLLWKGIICEGLE